MVAFKAEYMSDENNRGGNDRPRDPGGRGTGSRRRDQQGQPGQGQPQHGGRAGQGRGQANQGQGTAGQATQGSAGQGTAGRNRGQGPGGRGQGPGGSPQGGTRSGGIDFGSLPWVSGAVQGASYFFVSLITISLVVFVDFILISSGGGGGPGGVSGGSGQVLLYALGWLFYSAHFVDLSAGALGTQNLVELLGLAGLPSYVYYLLPPVFLFLAGRSIARSTGHAGMRDEELAARGATALAGYLPAAVLGSVVLTRNGVGPELSTTVLLMGVGYPLVFGGLGGFLAKR